MGEEPTQMLWGVDLGDWSARCVRMGPHKGVLELYKLLLGPDGPDDGPDGPDGPDGSGVPRGPQLIDAMVVSLIAGADPAPWAEDADYWDAWVRDRVEVLSGRSGTRTRIEMNSARHRAQIRARIEQRIERLAKG